MTLYREPKSWAHILLGFLGLIIIFLGALGMGAGYLLIRLGAMPLSIKPLADLDWVNREDGSIWEKSGNKVTVIMRGAK